MLHFVSYVITTRSGTGSVVFANTNHDFKGPVTEKKIEALRKKIGKGFGKYDNVTVLGWSPLGKKSKTRSCLSR